mmetsp:Transcript_32741/g.49341  ORF Transcript_32741/g.49341 Transcript_32741/m.49341 type:complete len:316 (+) Transcript_32741:77-1024(+)
MVHFEDKAVSITQEENGRKNMQSEKCLDDTKGDGESESFSHSSSSERPKESMRTKDNFRRVKLHAAPHISARTSQLHLQSVISHQAGYKRLSSHEEMTLKDIESAVATDVASCICNEVKTLALIAALLSSWAVTVYAGEMPMNEGLCYGAPMIQASYVVFWFSLGCFFVCTCSTLGIIGDIDGVPQKYLFKHFQKPAVRLIYQIPELSMITGVIFLALAYSLDIGERAGCVFLWLGLAAACGFIGLVAAVFILLKRARQVNVDYDDNDDFASITSIEKKELLLLGNCVISTWRDRMDHHTHSLHSNAEASNLSFM